MTSAQHLPSFGLATALPPLSLHGLSHLLCARKSNPAESFRRTSQTRDSVELLKTAQGLDAWRLPRRPEELTFRRANEDGVIYLFGSRLLCPDVLTDAEVVRARSFLPDGALYAGDRTDDEVWGLDETDESAGRAYKRFDND